MRKSLQMAAIIAAFGLMVFSALICSAQIMVGNFRDAVKTDKEVIGAANFAVTAQSKKQKTSLKLVSIEKAEKQVVAGVNYRLCLAIKSNNKSAQVTAIVYQNLQNQYKLTTWASGNCSGATTNATSSETISAAPDIIVKNLYAADKADKSPFFQAEDRALVDKYFTKDLADLIWKDAVDSKAGGGVGMLDFAPLYNAQDTQITAFKIGNPEYGEGNAQLADVPVTFKNMGKSETILFRLLQDKNRIWKISEIYYPRATDANTNSLKVILSQPTSD